MDEAEVVVMLVGMGFERELAVRAAQLAGASGVEGALELIEGSPELLAGTAPQNPLAMSAGVGTAPVPAPGGGFRPLDSAPRGLKAVFVVRADLQMSPGKIAAQVAHAALALVRNHHHGTATDDDRTRLLLWQTIGEKIVVVEVEGPQQMEALQVRAREVGLIQAEIHDAGRTEVEPGSQTVCGFGPHYEEEANKVTGHLSLLK
eukprot:3069122-Rhodomonas_salina.1